MLPATRLLSSLACLILAGTLLAGAQLICDDPDRCGKPHPKPQPKPSASLVVTTDLDCDWSLDGVPEGRLKAHEIKTVRLSPGKHVLQATSSDGQDTFQNIVTIGQSGQEATQILLSSLRQARIEKEQKEAERKQSEARRLEEERKRPTWSDPATNLMWARQDNGRDLNWNLASKYCSTLSLGGYLSWRLPTYDELAGIYDPTQDVNGQHVKGQIRITGWLWSSNTGTFPSEAWTLNLRNGNWYSYPMGYGQLRRALCVRRP